MRALEDLPQTATIYEVGPRDGLQNESERVDTHAKVNFVELLREAGLPFVEVTSFVRPDRIPQLDDAEEVLAQVSRSPRCRYTALVPNVQGMQRVAKHSLDGIALFTAASETFNRKNANAGIAETLGRFQPVVNLAKSDGLWIRGYVSTAFGCPYEGKVDPAAVTRVSRDLLRLGVDQVAISDTIGVATPADVVRIVGAVASEARLDQLALHFHDTRGTALANVLAGLQLGITTYDSSAGGLGGCPYAPGASGNLATEDLVYMLDGLGIETGVSLAKVVEASRYLADVIGHPPASRYFSTVA